VNHGHPEAEEETLESMDLEVIDELLKQIATLLELLYKMALYHRETKRAICTAKAELRNAVQQLQCCKRARNDVSKIRPERDE